MPTCDRFEIGERQRIFSSAERTMCVHVSAYSQCQIPFCYTDGLLSAGRGITVPRNSLVWRLQTAPAQDKLYRTPNFAGAFRYNAQKNCATRVCRACVDETTCVAVRYLALRIGRRKGRTRSWSVRSRGRILCRSPYFAAVTCRHSAPDSPKRKWELRG